MGNGWWRCTLGPSGGPNRGWWGGLVEDLGGKIRWGNHGSPGCLGRSSNIGKSAPYASSEKKSSNLGMVTTVVMESCSMLMVLAWELDRGFFAGDDCRFALWGWEPCRGCSAKYFIYFSWWLIPLSKWIITPIINGISVGLIHINHWCYKPLTSRE